MAVIGSGFSGIGTAVRLKEAGIHDFVILERSDDLGGTWRDNTYPGAACDVPSRLYEFEFAPNPDWTRSFSRQQDIWDYLRDCAERHEVLPHVYFGHEMLCAQWDDSVGRWFIETSRGPVRSRVLVSGAGPLSEPAWPSIDGLDTFRGTVFHSAAWDHTHDLTGERVAVIGTGASAAQFIPEIQPDVRRLYVFQRTPSWVMPRHDRALTRFERRLYRKIPLLQRLVRAAIYHGREFYVIGFTIDQRLLRNFQKVAIRHLERQVADPRLRAKLTPSYTMGCKRIVLSSDYYPALTQTNVEVVTEPIREIGGRSVVTADGREREVDTIICGTGFRATSQPIAERVYGRDGRSLADAWRDGMRAYGGTTVSGFPNLFLLLGPNTGGGHTSVVLMAEAQMVYIREAVRYLVERGITAVDVVPEAMRRYDDAVQRRMRRTVWVRGGCDSWYLDEHGKNTTLWPSFVGSYRRRMKRFDPESYEHLVRSPQSSPASVRVE